MIIETSHILIRDVENQTIPFRDKRKKAEWYDFPLVKGTRLVLRKVDTDTFSNLNGFDYEIGLDVSGEREPSRGNNFIPVAFESVNGSISFHAEKSRKHARSLKEKVEVEARVLFQISLWSSIGQPVYDYKSVFNDCKVYSYRSASDALHQLHASGKITLDDIRQALIQSVAAEKVCQ